MRLDLGHVAVQLTLWLAASSSLAAQNVCGDCLVKADAQFRAGSRQAAVDQLRSCARQCPKWPAPHLALAGILREQGKLDEASREFESALRLDPNNVLAAAKLAQTRFDLKAYQGAKAAAQAALKLAPGDRSLLFLLFQCQIGLREFDDAAKTGAKIAAATPDDARVFTRLAAEQAQAGDYAHAAANLERAVALDPVDQSARYNLGLAAFHAGDAARALEVLTPLRVDPGGAEIENLLGDVFEALQRPLDAAHAFQKAAELAPANEDYRFDFVYELLHHQSYEGALRVAERAVVDFPQSTRMRLAWAIALHGQQQSEQALTVLFDAAHQASDPGPALPMLSFVALERQERLDELEKMLAAYRKQHPESPAGWLLGGKLALERGDPSAAGLLRRAVELSPGGAEAHFQFGRALEGSDAKAALAEYRKAVELDPKLEQAWYRLGQVLVELGREDEAQQALDRFESLHKGSQGDQAVVRFLVR